MCVFAHVHVCVYSRTVVCECVCVCMHICIKIKYLHYNNRRGCFHGSLNAPDDAPDHQHPSQVPQAELAQVSD